MSVKLYNGDCLNIMSQISDRSIDMVLCDPPYGITPLEWDKEINFELLWKEYRRVCKDDACICLFGQEPFASKLRLSNIAWYKYDWYWKKERPTNIFQVKRRPAKYVENICVFYKKQCLYNVQKTSYTGKPHNSKPKGSSTKTLSSNELKVTPYLDDGTRYPCEILEFNRDLYYQNLHPTQKPVALLSYLIKTYTDKGMTVLDNCMGSGSTGIACLDTERVFIGIEKDENYFNIANKRINDYERTIKTKLF